MVICHESQHLVVGTGVSEAHHDFTWYVSYIRVCGFCIGELVVWMSYVQDCKRDITSHGILRSYNLVLLLYIYLILGGITLKNARKNHLASNMAITFICKELASQELLFNRICRKRKSENRYQSLLYYFVEWDFSWMQRLICSYECKKFTTKNWQPSFIH